MGQARDRAGNIWETDDATGEAVRLLQPAPSSGGRVVTLPQNPRQVVADARAERAEERAQKAEARAQAAFDKQNIEVQTPGDTTKTGEDYLATLPAPLAAQVKALAEGRRAFPTGSALRSPQVMELVAAASQYDPTLDAANAATRVATRKDFTSGKAATNITAINTALGHLGTLEEAARGLHNRSFPLWNTLANAAEQAVGDPRVKRFTVARDAAATELMRVFRGVGASTSEIEEWKGTIDSSDSPEQLSASIRQAVELLNSRLESMGQQYQQGLGTSADPLQLLSPHAREVYDRLSGQPEQRAEHEVDPVTGLTRADTNTPSDSGDLPPANMPGGNDPTPPPASGGGMHNLDHPEVRSMVASMVNAGAGLATINAALKQKGFPPVSFSQFGEVQKWMKANPGKQYPASAVDASTTERLNLLQRAAGSAPGAFAANTADAFTAGIPSYLAGDKGKGALEAMDALHPDASMLGTITGSLTGAIGGELAAAKLLAGAPRLAAYAPRLADAAFGGLSGFTGSGGDPLSAAAGAVIAPLAGKVGEGAINTLARGARGVTDPAVQYLRSRGIPLTFGQAVGHSGRAGEVIKGIEDAMTSTPGPGNMVDARRREGLRAFNEAAFRDAAPPGAVITATGAPGLAQVRQAVSDQYNRTLDPVTLDLMGDPAALDDITNATLRAHAIPQGTGEDAANALSFRIGGGMDQAGQMAGRDFQEAYRGLARDARGAASRQVPYAQEFGDVAREGQDALGLALERQNPGAFGGFVEANAANRRANVLASALNPNAPEELITPAQLNRADFTSTSRLTNRINAASGNRPFYDLATAGQAVLPSKLPDSGTAKRLALMALTGTLGQTGLTGAGYAVGGSQGAETGTELGLGTAALLTALGTRRGQRALTSLALDRPAFARAIADSIERNAAVGRVGGTTGGLALIHALNGQ